MFATIMKTQIIMNNYPEQKRLLHRNKLKRLARIRMKITVTHLLVITYAVVLVFIAIFKFTGQ
jgi:hypothetical protein